MVFDLDPGEGIGLLESAAVSLLLKDTPADLGLKAWVKTSAQGHPAYVPLNTALHDEETRTHRLPSRNELVRAPGGGRSNMRRDAPGRAKSLMTQPALASREHRRPS